MYKDFLEYLLRQGVGNGTETSQMAEIIGKMDVQGFEAEQGIKEIEDYQDRQFEAYIASFETEQ